MSTNHVHLSNNENTLSDSSGVNLDISINITEQITSTDCVGTMTQLGCCVYYCEP